MSKKKLFGLYMDKEIHHKLSILSMVRKNFFCEDDYSISHIVDIAVGEYFQNHKSEIAQIMASYHEQGGCGELEIEEETK